MKTSELRAKSKEELNELVMNLKKERFNLRFQEVTGALESKLRFREVKKTIARAKTILNEQAASTVAPKAAKAPQAPKTPKAPKAAKAPKKEKAPKVVKARIAKKKTAKAKKEA